VFCLRKSIPIATALIAMGFAASSHATSLFEVAPNPGGAMLKVSDGKDLTASTGTVVTPDDIDIAVTGDSDFANGAATIKPVGDAALTELIFTPSSDTEFDGFSFRGQDETGSSKKPQVIDVTVTDQNGTSEVFAFSENKSNADIAPIGIVSAVAGETIKSVEIYNSGGFKEAKQFTFEQVQPSGTPEPATWAMMLVGFGGLGATLRRARRRPASAAV